MDMELVFIILSLFSMKFFRLADTSHVRKNTQNIDLLNKKLDELENNFDKIQKSIDYCDKSIRTFEENLFCNTLNIFLDTNEPYVKLPYFINIINKYKNHYNEPEIEEDNEYSEIDDDGSRYEYKY